MPENPNNHGRTDCDRCGRSRPTNPERYAVTASDLGAGTADFEKVLLCADCWRRTVDDLRRCLA